jgi:hypothetical protein
LLLVSKAETEQQLLLVSDAKVEQELLLVSEAAAEQELLLISEAEAKKNPNTNLLISPGLRCRGRTRIALGLQGVNRTRIVARL